MVQKPEITTWSDNHPVMQYVSVHDVAIERASRIDPGDLTVIAASKQTPLIVASDKPKWVMLTFDLDSSDFPFHVGFPVFIDNVLSWFSREQLAIKRSPGDRGCSAAQRPDPNDRRQNYSVRTAVGQNRVFCTTDPGLYIRVLRAMQRVHVAVNLANPAFSDVNRSVFKTDRRAAEQHYWLTARTVVLHVVGCAGARQHRVVHLSSKDDVVRMMRLFDTYWPLRCS